MEFEYRRPDVEQALTNARTFDALEAALEAVTALMADLHKPEVYGQKLFAPALDAAVPVVARRLGLTDRPSVRSNDNVCIVNTRLYAMGGHSKVAFDISELIGPERTSVVVTDVYRKLQHRGLIGATTTPSPLKRRADLLLASATLAEKVVELYNLLAAVRPTRIFMNIHHFDMVAAVALWPFRDVVEFLHHADHVPSIGATLPWSAHVDLTWHCHQICKDAGLRPYYAGMTVLGGGEPHVPHDEQPKTVLRLGTCGAATRYRGASGYRWIEYVVAALSRPEVELVHMGPVDDEFRAEIARGLDAAAIDAGRYIFAGMVPDLASALTSHGVDIYLSSYPVGGGKANLEAMAMGLPTIVLHSASSPPLIRFDFPADNWIQVTNPADLDGALAIAQARAAKSPENREVIQRELARFESYVREGLHHAA